MGFLGILEDHKLPHVPGTVILKDSESASNSRSQLKHGSGKSQGIVLVPQPANDLNDPLNWSPIKKLAAFLIVAFGACIYAATYSPLLNSGLAVLAVEFDRSIGDITLITGYQLLVAGTTGPVFCALSRKYGKRPIFLLSAMFGLIGSIVGSATSSYNGLLAARIIQGFAVPANESLVISVIGDIYFVHQRGLYMSSIQFVLGCVSNFSSVICGIIVANLGWKYLFHFCVLFSGIQMVLMFLFVPETQYRRDRRYDIDELIVDNLDALAISQQDAVRPSEHIDVDKTEASISENEQAVIPNKKTFWQQKAILTGTYCNDSLLQLVIAPIAVCTNVVVLWVTVVTGTIVATYVAQAYVIAQIFSFPPYNLSAAGVGYLFLGPFIGGMVGAVFVGCVADPIIKSCSAKNNGVYEPEYRLIPGLVGLAAGAGLMGFGRLCEQHASYYATATLHGVSLFGIMVASAAVSGYALDAYREMSSEIFIVGMVFKNFLFYGWSYFVNNWTARSGPSEVFYVFGGVAFALVVSIVPVFFIGKRYRSFWARHNLLVAMHLRTKEEL